MAFCDILNLMKKKNRYSICSLLANNMKKFSSTLKLPRLVATMCVVLACCSTDESVEIRENKAENEADAESDLQFLGSWSTSQVSFHFMNIDGAMEFKDVLVGWSGWPEQEADAKLDSIDSELRPAFQAKLYLRRIIPMIQTWEFFRVLVNGD